MPILPTLRFGFTLLQINAASDPACCCQREKYGEEIVPRRVIGFAPPDEVEE